MQIISYDRSAQQKYLYVRACVRACSLECVGMCTMYTLLAVLQLRRLIYGFPMPRPWFEPGSDHEGFMVNKAALGQDSSEYFVSPASCSTDCSTLTIIRGWCNRPVMVSVMLESVLLHLKGKRCTYGISYNKE